MPKFRVKSNIQKDGKVYEPGATIELSEKEAAEMPWAIEPITEASAPPPEEKKIFIAVKEFQFRGEKVKEGEALQLTAEDAEKLGPERVKPEEPPQR